MRDLRRTGARRPALRGLPHVHDSRRNRRELPVLRRTGHHHRARHKKRPLTTPRPLRHDDGRLPTSTQTKEVNTGADAQASAATRPPTPPSGNSRTERSETPEYPPAASKLPERDGMDAIAVLT